MRRFEAADSFERLFLKFTGQAGDKLRKGELGIFHQGFEIQSQHHFLGLVGRVGIGKGGLGAASAGGGEVVAFAVHLGTEDTEKGRTEFGGRRASKADHLLGRDPVEIAPNLAAEDFARAIGRRELAEGLEAGEENGHMGFVAVSGVVEVEDLGFCRPENLKQVGGQSASARTADFGTGMSELENGGIPTQASRLFLLIPAGFDEVMRGKFFRGTRAGGSGAIGSDDAGKAEIFLPADGADAGKGHDLQVVRVGADAEMGGGGEGGFEAAPAGNKEVGVGLGKFHQ